MQGVTHLQIICIIATQHYVAHCQLSSSEYIPCCLQRHCNLPTQNNKHTICFCLLTQRCPSVDLIPEVYCCRPCAAATPPVSGPRPRHPFAFCPIKPPHHVGPKVDQGRSSFGGGSNPCLRPWPPHRGLLSGRGGVCLNFACTRHSQTAVPLHPGPGPILVQSC